MRLAALSLIGVCGLLLEVSSIPAREWSSRTGSYLVEAEYVDVQDGKVILEPSDGQRISVKLEKLSLDDLLYVEQRLDMTVPEAMPSPAGEQDPGMREGGPRSSEAPPPVGRGTAARADRPAPLDPVALAKFENSPILPTVPEDGLRYGREGPKSFRFTFTMAVDMGDVVERIEGRGDFQFDELVDTYRGQRRLPPEQTGSGTGFVVHPDGYLVTCAHVVEHAQTIRVHLGGQTYPGRVVSFVPRFDLALVQVPVKNLPALPILAGDDAKAGEKVRAIGFPIATVLGTSLKVTRGTVTNRVKGESSIDLLQIDAAVNPGNSGGPLVNDRGEVVGVIHAKRFGPDVSKVGFAVPASNARRLLDSHGPPSRPGFAPRPSRPTRPPLRRSSSRASDDGDTCPATALSVYEIQEVTSETITIKKTYRVEDSSENVEETVTLTLKGEGLITFNREHGVVQNSEFDGSLRFRENGQDFSVLLDFDLRVSIPSSMPGVRRN